LNLSTNKLYFRVSNLKNMKAILLFALLLIASTTTYAQKTGKLVHKIEQMANDNIPEGASLVVSYTYSIEGCMLKKTTLLLDETTYDVDYDLSKKIVPSFYDQKDNLHDVSVGGLEFVLAFKVKDDADLFIKTLEKLSKKCSK